MADILDEIKEDIKQEKYERLITIHGFKILILCGIIIAITASYKIIKSYQYNKSVEQGKVYYEAFENNKMEAYDEILASDHAGFKVLASFSKAGIQKSKGKIDESIQTLENIDKIDGPDKLLQDYAKLSALVLRSNKEGLSDKEKAEIDNEFKEFYTVKDSFDLTAKQSHAIFLHKIGKNIEAKELLKELAVITDVPPSFTDRSRNFIKIIDSKSNE